MTKHYEGRIHWARLLKYILACENSSCAVYDLAAEFELMKNDVNLENAINQLVKQGRAKLVMGFSSDGLPCRVVVVIKPHQSKRDEI